MRTMHPVLKRGGLWWDRNLMPPEAVAARFPRTQQAIAAAGDDAWLVYGDVERYGHVAWFSNFLPRTRAACALVPAQGAPAILVSVGQRDVPAAKTLTWVEDVRPFSRLPRSLAALVEEKGLANARIGLVGIEDLLSAGEWNDIAAALPDVEWQDRTPLLQALRASKDEHELNAVRHAARAVSDGLLEAGNVLRRGLSMRQATARIDRIVRRDAAEDVRILVAGGPQAGVALRPADDRMLEAGDTVLLVLAAEVQRYWAQAASTFVLGRASGEMRELFAHAETAVAAMRREMKPGAYARDICTAAETALGDKQLAASARAYGFGHAIGLDAQEPPFLEAASPDRIAAHAPLALHIVCHAGGRGVALGQTIVTAENGVPDILVDAPGLIELRG